MITYPYLSKTSLAWTCNAYHVIHFESIPHCPQHWELLEMSVFLQNDKNDSLTYAVVSYSRTKAILKSFDSWVITQLACAPNRDRLTVTGVSVSTHTRQDNGRLGLWQFLDTQWDCHWGWADSTHWLRQCQQEHLLERYIYLDTLRSRLCNQAWSSDNTALYSRHRMSVIIVWSLHYSVPLWSVFSVDGLV